MTALVGEVQQWRDGRWRTILTESGIPVNDRRRHPYHNPGPTPGQQEGVLFGFDPAGDGPIVYSRGGRVYSTYDRRSDHVHINWGRP